ncbi:hypothetical protein DPMN_180907 [Dreissena polymorpha]|uniref:Uncharacterized protein n=1 Tax=Dreissena polymorpha TaxID=45954 RepID=A0A9D4I397_DREPO|nr:hypothetical protein DPMN_180907 [Dreissena polymorpha]
MSALTKRLAGKFSKTERPVRDETGGIIKYVEGRRRGGLSTSKRYSTDQLLRTQRIIRQLHAICQSSASLP